jgi:hypothetical protein
MANTLIPIEERSLTPQQVEALDNRRRRGQLLLVLSFQSLILASLVVFWVAQDLANSPRYLFPMFYVDAALFLLAVVFGFSGVRLRRGTTEFMSY